MSLASGLLQYVNIFIEKYQYHFCLLVNQEIIIKGANVNNKSDMSIRVAATELTIDFQTCDQRR